jgi:hypothetical protein
MLLLIKKNPEKKKKYETVPCPDATASSFVAKVQDVVFVPFHAIAIKHQSSKHDCLACPDECLVNSPLDAKENYEHASDFALHLSCLLWAVTFFPESLSNHCQVLCYIFSEICTTFGAHSL